MGRVGLVLGAGGAVGHAFHAGVLAALEKGTGWKPNRAEVIVGTSAGSIVAALLRAGCSAADLADGSLGEPVSAAGRVLFSKAYTGGEGPIPRIEQAGVRRGPSAPGLLLRPWGVRPGALGAALLPAGRISTEAISSGVRNLYGAEWPAMPTWICAVRLDDGRLVVFGKPGSPPATLAEAVAASCAIPAYFEPVAIAGARHVDGGVHSVTNADQLVGAELDLVLVSCPMGPAGDSVRLAIDTPIRAAVGFRLSREADAVRRSGIELVSLLPTAADREAMGGDPMDSSRRQAVTKSAYNSTQEQLADPGFRRRLRALG